MTIPDICVNNALQKSIDKLKFIKNGVLRDITMRALIYQDEPWWAETRSDWKLAIQHPMCSSDSYPIDYWEERVLDLCEYEQTRSHFGLSFNDLMAMEVPIFEKIEKRVHALVKRLSDNTPKEIKEGLKMRK